MSCCHKSNTSVLMLGPYIGSFQDEVKFFMPHSRWVASNVLKADKIVVTTHKNRTFMYDQWADTIAIDPFLSGYDMYSGIVNKKVNRQNYLKYSLEVKNNILSTYNIHKNALKTYSLNYTQTNQFCSTYQKTYSTIPCPKDLIHSIDKNTILFFPDPSESEDRLYTLLTKLRTLHNVVVIGDHTTLLDSENILLNPLYIQDNYKYIIKWMAECKLVVCPTGFWSFLSALQQVPYFSWGPLPGPYKTHGSCVIQANKDTQIERIYNQVLYYINSLEA